MARVYTFLSYFFASAAAVLVTIAALAVPENAWADDWCHTAAAYCSASYSGCESKSDVEQCQNDFVANCCVGSVSNGTDADCCCKGSCDNLYSDSDKRTKCYANCDSCKRYCSSMYTIGTVDWMSCVGNCGAGSSGGLISTTVCPQLLDDNGMPIGCVGGSGGPCVIFGVRGSCAETVTHFCHCLLPP